MAWAEDYRQNWIAETLRVFGHIQRQNIMRRFGISLQQASLDLRRFQAEQPGLITYDNTAQERRALVQMASKVKVIMFREINAKK